MLSAAMTITARIDSASIRPALRRIDALDLARGLALVAMAIYHFAWDLEFFGYAPPGMTAEGGWRLFARLIASSFLFLVGVSLVLAHLGGFRLRPYLKRLAMVAGAAALISLATWFAVPQGFIFFGILHQIALASVLGLAFLRVHGSVILAVAAFMIAGPHFLKAEIFAHPALWWVGLAPSNPPSNDYVPLFPWFGAVLAGMAAARIGLSTGFLAWLGNWQPGAAARPLLFAGRHSLAVYLLHQPALIALIWLFALVAPPQPLPPSAQFIPGCERSCGQTHDGAFCRGYCACMLDALTADNLLDTVFEAAQDAETQAQLNHLAGACSMRFQGEPFDGGQGEGTTP